MDYRDPDVRDRDVGSRRDRDDRVRGRDGRVIWINCEVIYSWFHRGYTDRLEYQLGLTASSIPLNSTVFLMEGLDRKNYTTFGKEYFELYPHSRWRWDGIVSPGKVMRGSRVERDQICLVGLVQLRHYTHIYYRYLLCSLYNLVEYIQEYRVGHLYVPYGGTEFVGLPWLAFQNMLNKIVLKKCPNLIITVIDCNNMPLMKNLIN